MRKLVIAAAVIVALQGCGIALSLLPVLQADNQSGGAALTANTVGLPDSTVRESRDRVPAAIRNVGLEFPVDSITVNLTSTCRR